MLKLVENLIGVDLTYNVYFGEELGKGFSLHYVAVPSTKCFLYYYTKTQYVYISTIIPYLLLHDVNELFLSFYSLMKGSPYVFYSHGKITIKGLGQRQTYLIEPPSSTVNSHLELVRNDSDSSSSIPIVNVDEETSPNLTLSRKEEVLRSPSFVTYNKCTMVSTPSVQFLHTAPSIPTFEDDNRERRSSSPGNAETSTGLFSCINTPHYPKNIHVRVS